MHQLHLLTMLKWCLALVGCLPLFDSAVLLYTILVPGVHSAMDKFSRYYAHSVALGVAVGLWYGLTVAVISDVLKVRLDRGATQWETILLVTVIGYSLGMGFGVLLIFDRAKRVQTLITRSRLRWQNLAVYALIGGLLGFSSHSSAAEPAIEKLGHVIFMSSAFMLIPIWPQIDHQIDIALSRNRFACSALLLLAGTASIVLALVAN